jgi:hypothetical protein
MTMTATPGVKMCYLIRRRATTTREELIAHWFANHMPGVIARQRNQAERGRRHATRYIATLFDADAGGNHPWDGIAQLWWDAPLPRPAQPHGSEPTDSFQQKAEPYSPWPMKEHVVIDGPLPVEPLTLNDPFPCTRSGFFKLAFLVKAQPDADFDALFRHWLEVHVPNVVAVMNAVGGFRYVVSHSLEPGVDPYAGMAELYFADSSGWAAYRERIQRDGMERFVDAGATLALRARTEMIGIA